MNIVKLKDTKLIHRNLLHPYILQRTIRKKLRKQSYLQSHEKKKNNIHSNKEVKDSNLENYRTSMKENGHK